MGNIKNTYYSIYFKPAYHQYFTTQVVLFHTFAYYFATHTKYAQFSVTHLFLCDTCFCFTFFHLRVLKRSV